MQSDLDLGSDDKSNGLAHASPSSAVVCREAFSTNRNQLVTEDEVTLERAAKEIAYLASSMYEEFDNGVRGSLFFAFRIGLLVKAVQDSAPRKARTAAVKNLATLPDTQLSERSLHRYLALAKKLPKRFGEKLPHVAKKNEFVDLTSNMTIREALKLLTGRPDAPTLDGPPAKKKKKRLPVPANTAGDGDVPSTPAADSSLHLLIHDTTHLREAIRYAERLGFHYRCVEIGIYDEGLVLLVHTATSDVPAPIGLSELDAFVQCDTKHEVEQNLQERVVEYWTAPTFTKFPG